MGSVRAKVGCSRARLLSDIGACIRISLVSLVHIDGVRHVASSRWASAVTNVVAVPGVPQAFTHIELSPEIAM